MGKAYHTAGADTMAQIQHCLDCKFTVCNNCIHRETFKEKTKEYNIQYYQRKKESKQK